MQSNQSNMEYISYDDEIDLKCEISSDLDTLNELYQQYRWLPNSNQVRPCPEIIQIKQVSMLSVRCSWVSLRDYILYKVFNKPMEVVNEQFRVDPSAIGQIQFEDRVFRRNDFPYAIEEGNHWILWYCTVEQPFSSATITQHIEEDIQRITDKNRCASVEGVLRPVRYNFAWYINPKMSVEEFFHVHVFWTTY
jgi:hypothetical protein